MHTRAHTRTLTHTRVAETVRDTMAAFPPANLRPDAAWQHLRFDLSRYEGLTIRLAFRSVDNRSIHLPLIDNVRITCDTRRPRSLGLAKPDPVRREKRNALIQIVDTSNPCTVCDVPYTLPSQ